MRKKNEPKFVSKINCIIPNPTRSSPLNVAAYCRVSTLLDTQKSSLEGQRRHYEQLIGANPDWHLAGIYLERGVTATKAENRAGLQQLLQDCQRGKIDLILTKSISRFARNTTECLAMVRQLTALGVDVFFEKEQIKTGSMESELLLTLLACFAEEESHSISNNLKWSLRKKFEEGSYRQAIVPYGYRRERNHFVIYPEEAKIVRGIFNGILEGKGTFSIAKELNQRKIPSPRGGIWHPSTIRQLIYNPVYAGDVLYQKTYVDSTFRQRKNKGKIDQFYMKGHHQEIISRDQYQWALEAVHQRGKECGTYSEAENPVQAKRRRNRYGFSGKLVCAQCGSVMYRQKNSYYAVYFCPTHQKNKTICPTMPEMENNIKNAFLTCLNKLAFSQNQTFSWRILDNYIRWLHLEEKKQGANYSNLEKAKEFRQFLRHWTITDRTEDFPEAEFRCLVEKAEVSSGKTVIFHFACGMNLTESLGRGEK